MPVDVVDEVTLLAEVEGWTIMVVGSHDSEFVMVLVGWMLVTTGIELVVVTVGVSVVDGTSLVVLGTVVFWETVGKIVVALKSDVVVKVGSAD